MPFYFFHDYLNKDGLSYFYTKISSIFATKTELDNWTPSGGQIQYPVGALYFSTSSTNPTSYFGGTWELWGSGRTPVAVDPDDSDLNAADATGGEKSHLLQETEIPAHTHTYDYMTTVSDKSGASGNPNKYRLSSRPTTTTGVGGGTYDSDTGSYVCSAHNNLQPYMVCYIWKKTAN